MLALISFYFSKNWSATKKKIITFKVRNRPIFRRPTWTSIYKKRMGLLSKHCLSNEENTETVDLKIEKVSKGQFSKIKEMMQFINTKQNILYLMKITTINYKFWLVDKSGIAVSEGRR